MCWKMYADVFLICLCFGMCICMCFVYLHVFCVFACVLCFCMCFVYLHVFCVFTCVLCFCMCFVYLHVFCVFKCVFLICSAPNSQGHRRFRIWIVIKLVILVMTDCRQTRQRNQVVGRLVGRTVHISDSESG